MKKSKQIVNTIDELLEHYAPWLMGLVLLGLAAVILYGALKEIKGLGLDDVEAGLVFLFLMSVFYWSLGIWAGQNAEKIKKDDDEDETNEKK